MDVVIIPRRLCGTLTPPPSKSLANRIILVELLAGRDAFSVPADLSEDIQATLRCASSLREKVSSTWEKEKKLPLLDCGESCSTLRFLMPTALALRGGGVFTGRGRLMERPVEPYRDLFREKGILWEQTGNTITIRGKLTAGEYRLPGNVSSQFLTGLLYALPVLDGDSVLRLTSPLESSAYVDLTLDVLDRCGVTVRRQDAGTFLIPGGQKYRADGMIAEADGMIAEAGGVGAEAGGVGVEADWSQAAFWCAANFLGNRVTLRGVSAASLQGDRVIVPLFRKMASPLPVPLWIDLSGIPDLFPPLAVMAAWRTSPVSFTGAGRLRLKESDRLDSVERLLRSFHISVRTGPDWMKVNGGIPDQCPPVTVDGCGDHRIVMAAAVLSSVWEAPVTIRGAEAARKSYPAFFEDYRKLGGEVHVL